nr:hypothetical protein [Tanacetum cinerariifolium]
TIDTTIDQQVAMDEALVPHARRLRIERINFRLLSDISFKEYTLQLVYDVLRLTPFFKAFLVTADVQKIYRKEFWATATVHHHSIRDSGVIRRLTDVNINKLHQPWRSFEAIINKCLTRKSLGYDSLRLNIKIQRRAMRCIILGSQRDDHMFTTIKLVSRPQNTQQFGAMLPIELTNADIKNSDSYKEYYAVATGATPPKTKASKQPASTSKAKSLSARSEVAMIKKSADEEGDDDDEENDGDDGEEGNDDDNDAQDDDVQDDDDQEDEGKDEDDQEEGSDDEQAFDEEEFIHPSLSTHDEEETRDKESFDPISKIPKNTDDEGNGEENLGMNVGREEGQDEEDEEDELYRDVNINLGRGVKMADVHTTQEFEDFMLNPTPDTGIESIFETTSQMDVQTPTLVVPLPVSVPTLTPSTIAPLRNKAQAENDEFLKTIDENMQKIIKEQVKEQVKVQVSKILLKIKQTVNEQLEAEVLTRSSNSSKTSYVIAADLSEIELKKILIEKMKSNKSIHRSNEQRNLYEALVEAYESDKIILDTYGDTVTLKRRCNYDADKDEEPSSRSDRGSKRRRDGNELESASAPKEKATRSADKSTQRV